MDKEKKTTHQMTIDPEWLSGYLKSVMETNKILVNKEKANG